ncbi:MAG TPA: prepilin-type N-terminal cleavage/methylation domain-containing protein, partial [Pyrinomonadaceae bacterium]|nr:prepilin-type N-terminal cleavage/methylation domain-containing protein [Pyrinomonadaceae bacterium]
EAMKSTDKTMPSGRKSAQQGFTLLEVAVALLVMMIVGLGAASMFIFALGTNTRSRDRELSMAVAQEQMERLRNTQFANLDATLTATGGANKTVISAGRSYSVVTTIANTVAGDSTQKTITVAVTPRGSNSVGSNAGGSGLTAVQRVFGGVTLITIRSTNSLGPYKG